MIGVDPKNAEELIEKAIIQLIFDHPFYASILMEMERVNDKYLPAIAGTDGISLYYHKDRIEKYIKQGELDTQKMMGVLVHEALHITKLHHLRLKNRDKEKWNYATDMVINRIINDIPGLQLPSFALPGVTYETYSEELYEKLPDPPQGQGNSQWNIGAIREPRGEGGRKLTPDELRRLEHETKIRIAKAYRMAKSYGKVGSDVEMIVKELMKPRIDWRKYILTFVQSNLIKDYQWIPPDRRFVHTDLYLPSEYGEKLENVVVIFDASGSVAWDENLMKEIASDINGLLQQFDDVEITVIYHDTVVTHTEKFTSYDVPIVLHPKGAGGTNFKPAYEWIDKNIYPLPSCVIHFTDMECDQFPEKPPIYPVLWVKYGNCDIKPPFGSVIEMDRRSREYDF